MINQIEIATGYKDVLKNPQLSPPDKGDIKRSPDPPLCRAVLKNIQTSPPETKEKESPPDLKEIESIPALQCSAVLKKIQLSPPEITNKTFLLVIWRTYCQD